MQPSTKYHINADIRADGVVERSDVVGAIFGQTEGLLGDELDLRELQDSSKVGRIHVEIDSEDGRSFGEVTIASGLDRVETAVLAAALETIERVGPCRADCTVTSIEDARAAKRSDVVDRATALLSDVERETMVGERLVEEVRKQARVEAITTYEGLPAGPRVEDSDAIIVVEGRADVRQLLEFGIKNAIAVEGTDVPEIVAALTTERNTTAFLDGDRGGDLILRELQQVGDVDYVAFAPVDRSVEDLDRATVMHALRKKVPTDQLTDSGTAREGFQPGNESPSVTSSELSNGGPDGAVQTDRSGDSGVIPATEGDPPESVPGEPGVSPDDRPENERASKSGGEVPDSPSPPGVDSEQHHSADSEVASTDADSVDTNARATPVAESESTDEKADATEPAVEENESEKRSQTVDPTTLADHVADVVDGDTAVVRLLDASFEIIGENAVDGAFDALKDAEETPHTVVLDGPITQRLLDVAAQRGIGQLIGSDTDDFVKQPTSVRIRTAEELMAQT